MTAAPQVTWPRPTLRSGGRFSEATDEERPPGVNRGGNEGLSAGFPAERKFVRGDGNTRTAIA